MTTPDPRAVLQDMIDIGVIRAQTVEEARLKSKRMQERGKEVAVLELLFEQLCFTEDQWRRFTTGHGKVIPTCFRCLKRNVLDEDGFSGSFICKHCQEPVSFKDRTAGLGDELLPNPPARIVDKLVEKLVQKGGVPAAKVEGLKRERKKIVPRPTLLEMFELKGMIKGNQLLGLKGKAEAIYRKRFAEWSKLAQDFELATFLCKTRVVAQKVLSAHLQRQMEQALNNRYIPLRDTLVRDSALTEYQVREFLPEIFDKVTRRMEVLNSLPGAEAGEEDEDFEDSEWEDSLVELGSEIEDDEENLNVISLDEEGPDPELNPRDAAQRKMFSSFYNRELKDLGKKK